MIHTTTPTIEGHPIQEYYGLVTAEVIIGANVIKDFAAGLHDFWGGRATCYEKTLRKAKDEAMKELSKNAEEMGANAIVGIDLDYETIGPRGGILMVCVNGTAVRI